MRIASGVTDQYIYFVAVDATDLKTREIGLSSFTVYRSRNGGAAAAYTTPTINETDNSNMPGVYELLLDEDMTIDSGDETQELCLHITHAGMAPVTRVIELYRPKITAGNTLGVAADGDISGNVDGSVASVVGNVGGNVTGSVGSLATQAKADVNAEVDTALSDYDAPTHAELVSEINAVQSDIAGLNNLSTSDVKAEVDQAFADYDPPTMAELSSEIDDVQSDIAGLSFPTAADVADAVWDEPIEGSWTARQLKRLMSAVLLGKATGGTGTNAFRNIDDTKTRVTATVSNTGNRSDVTYDAS